MKDELIFNIITIVFLIFFVGSLILVFWRMGKKRTEQFALISAELKLNFFPKGSTSLFERLKPFHLFSKGWSRKIKNLMEKYGGRGGIRTPGAIARTTLFESAPFDHSGTLPAGRAFWSILVPVQVNW